MKLNKFLIAATFLGLTFSACENELTDDAELNVNVVTGDGVSFDGETITVQAGTAIDFEFSGDPDYLTFFSGEAGSEYQYRERTTVDESEVASSTLEFSLQAQYGAPANILTMYISTDFPGIEGDDFEADSVLVESHDWDILISPEEFPTKTGTTNYSINMAPYMGERIALAICYRGQDNTQVQSRFYFKNMQITNVMTSGQETTLLASSFGFTPINMLYKHALSDQRTMTSNRAYGTVTNNTSGIWNFSDMTNFFIHSSSANTELKYSWIVSNLFVVNACSPDSGTGIKNITQTVNSYSYTYDEAGTYTATFVATNANYKRTDSVIREYKVVVTE